MAFGVETMTWQDEMGAVETALAELLPQLSRPSLSVSLGNRLAPLVRLPEPRVRKILGWIAKAGHPNATQDGGKVSLYGRTVDLWRWHPLPQREAGRPAATVVDTQDW